MGQRQTPTRRLIAVAFAVLSVIVVAIAAAVSSGESHPHELAFVTGGPTSAPQVWLQSSGSRGARLLGPGDHPLVSPDGDLVAASAPGRGGPALSLYGTSAGSGARRFFSAAAVSAMPLAFSPDSRYLAVALTSTDPFDSRGSGLALIDTATMTPAILATGVVQGASFAPDGSDRLAYALAADTSVTAPVDVFVAAADGHGQVRITHDGASLNPVWGSAGIAFDRERRRPHADPAYAVWLMHPNGAEPVRLMSQSLPPLQSGLVPLAFSSDGRWLLANSTGLNTRQAWVISVAAHRAHALVASATMTTARAISARGDAALVDLGGFLASPSAARVATIPLAGGRARVLIPHGSEPA